jgi:predicted RNA-binding Zn-ribbon protein involved in translation (DUF1610 family)
VLHSRSAGKIHRRAIKRLRSGMTQEYSTFRNSQITCKACGWTGLGRETQVGEVFEGGQISEYHCPRCGEYLRAVPWPLVGESQK